MFWKITVMFLIFTGLFLVTTNINLNLLNQKYKEIKEKTKKERNRIHLSTFTPKLNYIERLIQRSNIRVFFPYSVSGHLFFCFIFFFLGFLWINQYMNFIVSIIFGIGLSILPFLFLRVITDIVSYKVKRSSVDFLIILKNFFISGKNTDIFESFKKASNYIAEPLKTYINIMLYEHEHKVNPIQCLDNLKDNIEVSELKIFVENLKISYIHGGDIVGLIDAFIEEISDQNDDEDEESTEDTILNVGLYILLMINFVVIYILINSNYRYSILQPIWGQIIFVVDIIISIYIVIQSMGRLPQEGRD